MEKFVINGKNQLKGKIKISGSKNAILPLMAAAILVKGKTILKNVPRINDIKMMAHLLRIIGAKVEYSKGTMIIDGTHCSFCEAPYELVSKMRASIYVLGPLLARFRKAKVSFPGGCAIGNRPIDLHLKAMKELNATIEIKKGYINAKTKKLCGNEIVFEKTSVGATANTIMAAVTATGKTIIENAAIEPEIGFLIDTLNKMGAEIEGKDSPHLSINGVKDLKPVEIDVIPDRIEAGTFIIAGAMNGNDITVENCIPNHLNSLLEKIKQTGANLTVSQKSVHIKANPKITPTNITTNPYPAFPTDLQAQFMTLMSISDGISSIQENIFPDRFMHVAELNRLHANIEIENNIAIIRGVNKLSGAKVMATDLRASAALVLAGLAAEGKTEISRIYHIDRGYDRIEKKLKALGADIERVLA